MDEDKDEEENESDESGGAGGVRARASGGAQASSSGLARVARARWAPRPPCLTMRRGEAGGGDAQVSCGILSRGHIYEITTAIFFRLASTQTQTYHQKEGEQEIAVQLCSLAQINHLFLQARETQPMAALDFEQRGAPRRLHAPLAH